MSQTFQRHFKRSLSGEMKNYWLRRSEKSHNRLAWDFSSLINILVFLIQKARFEMTMVHKKRAEIIAVMNNRNNFRFLNKLKFL